MEANVLRGPIELKLLQSTTELYSRQWEAQKFLNIHFILLKFLFYTSVELKHMKKHAMCDVGRDMGGGNKKHNTARKMFKPLSSQYWRSKFTSVQCPRTWSVQQKFTPLKMSMAYTLYTIQM